MTLGESLNPGRVRVVATWLLCATLGALLMAFEVVLIVEHWVTLAVSPDSSEMDWIVPPGRSIAEFAAELYFSLAYFVAPPTILLALPLSFLVHRKLVRTGRRSGWAYVAGGGLVGAATAVAGVVLMLSVVGLITYWPMARIVAVASIPAPFAAIAGASASLLFWRLALRRPLQT